MSFALSGYKPTMVREAETSAHRISIIENENTGWAHQATCLNSSSNTLTAMQKLIQLYVQLHLKNDDVLAKLA